MHSPFWNQKIFENRFCSKKQTLDLAVPEMTAFTFTHTIFDYQDTKYISAMNRVRAMIAAENFSANAFAVTMEYANWETTEVLHLNLAPLEP